MSLRSAWATLCTETLSPNKIKRSQRYSSVVDHHTPITQEALGSILSASKNR
jgi:hypothetical protein